MKGFDSRKFRGLRGSIQGLIGLISKGPQNSAGFFYALAKQEAVAYDMPNPKPLYGA